jgi:hypothetical protein
VQAPGIALAQVDLLQVLVEPAFGEQMLLAEQFVGQQRHLRQLRGTVRPAHVGQPRGLRQRGVADSGSRW